jgi:hypothetical protein
MLATRNGIGSLRDSIRIYEGSILNFRIEEKCLDNMRMSMIFYRKNHIVFYGTYYRDQFACNRMIFDLEYPEFLNALEDLNYIGENGLQKGR